MSTLYQDWLDHKIGNFGSFQTTILQAYTRADNSNKEILERAYPDWFVRDEEKEAKEEKEANELYALELAFNKALYENPELKALEEKVEDKVKEICEKFLTTEAADRPEEFMSHILSILRAIDEESGLEDVRDAISYEYFSGLVEDESPE